jgi:hypothetical protein
MTASKLDGKLQFIVLLRAMAALLIVIVHYMSALTANPIVNQAMSFKGFRIYHLWICDFSNA